MAVKIDKKITGYALVNEQDKLDAAAKEIGRAHV